MKRNLVVFILILLLFAGYLVVQKKNTTNVIEPNLDSGSFKVVRAIDGDTIELEGGERVRYLGVDTPESVQPDKKVECFGIEAAKKNKKLVEGRVVRLEKDISDRDKYGRLLRYVHLKSASVHGDEIFVNLELVKQGYAYAVTFPPDVKFYKTFIEAQREARKNKRGLWSGCRDEKELIKEEKPTLAAPDKDCNIKGNISIHGDRIYHLPDGEYYDQTWINPSRGEKWFCLEEEAVEAGWRKSMK